MNIYFITISIVFLYNNANFFLGLVLFRAAQKLNLSSKKKKHHAPLLHSHGVSIYATNFSGILQMYPPPAPPCLLRAVSKVKDNPGIGKVFKSLFPSCFLNNNEELDSQMFSGWNESNLIQKNCLFPLTRM